MPGRSPTRRPSEPAAGTVTPDVARQAFIASAQSTSSSGDRAGEAGDYRTSVSVDTSGAFSPLVAPQAPSQGQRAGREGRAMGRIVLSRTHATPIWAAQ